MDLGQFCNDIDLFCISKNAKCAYSHEIFSQICQCKTDHVAVYEKKTGHFNCCKSIFHQFIMKFIQFAPFRPVWWNLYTHFCIANWIYCWQKCSIELGINDIYIRIYLAHLNRSKRKYINIRTYIYIYITLFSIELITEKY